MKMWPKDAGAIVDRGLRLLRVRQQWLEQKAEVLAYFSIDFR